MAGLNDARGTGDEAASNYAPVAQLDRVPGYEPGGREFESLRARHFSMTYSCLEQVAVQ
jgi:hypothetical protein